MRAVLDASRWRPSSQLLLGIAVLWLGASLALASERAHHATWNQILILSDAQYQGLPPGDQLYDPATNVFKLARSQIQALDEAAAIEISVGPNQGKILITGGYNVNGPLARSELYDPASGRFLSGPVMNDLRNSHTATTISSGAKAGWVLIIGGTRTNLYDPFHNRFVAGPRNRSPRWDHTATVIPSGRNAGKILIAGGWWEVVGELASCELYDPESGILAVEAKALRLNVARRSHTATIIPAGPNRNRIILIGGWGRKRRFDALSSTELYDPATNSFAPARDTPRMLTPRAQHVAMIIGSGPKAGMVLIAGGEDATGDALASTELYDPLDNRFEPGPIMHARRSGPLAITLQTGPNVGKILIAGGGDVRCHGESYADCTVQSLKSTEFYNPLTNLFEPGPDMISPGATLMVQLAPAPSPHITTVK